MIAFWIGVYLALGLPISLALAMVESGAPLIRRVLMGLIYLPAWPAWTAAVVAAYVRVRRPQVTCAWCGEVVGDDTQDWRAHLMECRQHPIREWLHDQGWDIDRDSDGYVLGEYKDGES